MAVTCTEIAALGADLLTQGTEVADRSGVSRLYYGALHRAREWIKTTPGTPDSGGYTTTHAKLQHELKHLSGLADAAQRKKARKLEVKLATLKKRRTEADYMLGSQLLTPSEVAAQKAETDIFFSYCDQP